MTEENVKKAVKECVKALEDKKGEDIRIIDISEVSTLADYFTIASGSSVNQIKAMCDAVDEKLTRLGINKRQIEGYDAGNWVLMDYHDIVVHVFDSENRLFYDLERMWRDGKLVDKDEL